MIRPVAPVLRRGLRAAGVLGCLCAVGVQLCVAADDASESEPAAPESSYQDLIFFGEERPIVIRLHIFVDGRPFGEVWHDHVGRLFALADRDGDGRLSLEEARDSPETDDLLQEELSTILSLPGLAQADLRPADGWLSVEEFGEFVRRYRGGPFQSLPNRVETTDAMAPPVVAARTTTSGRVLFSTLDTDRNGRISVSEMESGAQSIRKVDFDGDGSGSVIELDHLRSPFDQAPGGMTAFAPVPIRLVSRESGLSEIVSQCILKYQEASGDDGGARARAGAVLPLSALGYGDGEGEEFDADRDGLVDRHELRYWLIHPQPHFRVTIRIGERQQGEESVTVAAGEAAEGLSVRTSDSGLISLVIGDVHLEFGVASGSHSADSVRTVFTSRFQQSDVDANGYLEREEVAFDPLFENSFSRFDVDGDGMLFEEELLAVIEGQIASALSRTRLTAANRGQDLFEILDVNRDGRVSQREFGAAAGRFRLWDVNDDSELSEDEIPELHQLVFGRGMPMFAGFANVGFLNGAMVPAATGPNLSGAPAWFMKMDRNGDGDVARREFLGTPEQFAELDVDENGLIDVIESSRAAAAE